MKYLSKIPGAFALVCIFALPAAAQSNSPIRVNCGGSSYTDSKGQTWRSDFGYNGGSAYTAWHSVGGTHDPALFQTGRQASSTSTPLIYSFAVANGNYHANLYFAETSNHDSQNGARVFNVKLEGITAFPRLDVFSAAGSDTALVEGIDFVVNDGRATIEFDSVTDEARVNAIEILPVSNSSPPLSLNFVYPDGTAVAGTLAYTISSSGLSFRGSVPLVNGQVQTTMLTSPAVLGLNVQFQVNLSLKDTTGNLLWQFAMGMQPSQINLGTVKSSALKVVVQKP